MWVRLHRRHRHRQQELTGRTWQRRPASRLAPIFYPGKSCAFLTPLISIVSVSRHGIGAGPCDNHAENAKKSCLFAPGDGGQTVAGSVLFYSAGDPTSGLCRLSQGRLSDFGIDPATPWLGGLHSRCDDRANLFSRGDKVGVRKMGIPRHRLVPAVSEQLADQRQVLAGHDGLAGGDVPQIVQPQPLQPGAHPSPCAGRPGRQGGGAPACPPPLTSPRGRHHMPTP